MSTEQQHEDEYQSSGAELVPIDRTINRTVDMRSRATDSWTDVLPDTVQLARGVAATEFVPTGLRCKCGQPQNCKCGGVAKTTAAMFYSRELGLPPMTGLGATHVIEGKAGISAEMMRALVFQGGHELVVKESTRQRCELWGRRKGQEEWTKVVWSMQEAQETNVYLGKDKGWGPISQKSQWKTWPTEMLLARATTRIVRMIFPDVSHGMRSTEELQDMQEFDVEVVEGGAPQAQIPAPSKVQRKRAPIKPRAERKPDTASSEPEASSAEAEPEAPAEEPEEPEEEPAPATKVQRTRKPRPAPRPAPEPEQAAPETEQAAPETTATVEALPDEDGVVDAEIVTEAPAQDSKPKNTAHAGAVKMMIMHWERLGVTERSERIWYTSIVAGREVKSANDLDLEEARKVVTVLERAKDLTAIDRQFIDKKETE